MVTERDTHPFAEHYHFPYFFSNAGTEDLQTTNRVGGINFRGIWHWDKDLIIYYGDRHNEDSGAYVECWCSRWSVDNYNIVIETWLKKEHLQRLIEGITPGATAEMFNILGLPKFYDKTWSGKNTIRLYPNLYKKKVIGESRENETIPSNLPYMRKEVTVYPKTITTEDVESNSAWVHLKLDCATSSNIEL